MSGSTITAIYGLLAQLVEQRTVNPWAAGSNPAQPAICSSGETGKRGGFKSRLFLSSTLSWSIYHRGVAQLVERRSPKPRVACSSRVTPATTRKAVLAKEAAFCFGEYTDQKTKPQVDCELAKTWYNNIRTKRKEIPKNAVQHC